MKLFNCRSMSKDDIYYYVLKLRQKDAILGYKSYEEKMVWVGDASHSHNKQ